MPHFPRGACACGADLAAAIDLGVAASHQQVEIPEMAAQVIQHDLHAVGCACGRVHRAAAPAGAGMPGTVTHGISVQAWCVYPAAIWPGQIADALRALINAANLARDQDLAAVPDHDRAADLRLFRHGVRVGLSQVPRIPGANVEQPPARLLLECLRDREDDVLRFLSDLRIPPTSNQAKRDVLPAKTQQKISGGGQLRAQLDAAVCLWWGWLSPLLSRLLSLFDAGHVGVLVLIITAAPMLARGPNHCNAQTPPPNPTAAGPDGRRVLSRVGIADHAVTPQAPWTGSGWREHSYGGFGGGNPHFHPHTVSADNPRIKRQAHLGWKPSTSVRFFV